MLAFKAELDDLDDTYAESVQLAFAAQTACAQAKGKAKPGGKPGGKVVHSNLTIADRKAEFAELKAKSRCLRNAASLATGPVTQHASLAARAVAPGAPQPRQRPVGAPRPLQSLREVVYLSNASAGRMEAYPAHLQGSPAKSDKPGKGSEGILSPQIRRTAVARIMRDRQPAGGVR